MAANDQAPACRKAATTLSPAARIEIGTPVASGGDRLDGAGEAPQAVVGLQLAPRKGLDAGAAVARDPIRDDVGWKLLHRDRTGLKQRPHALEHDAERQHDRRRGGGPDVGRGLAQAVERAGEAQRRL